MKKLTTPVGAAFDIQRRTIEGTHESMQQTMEIQQQFATMAWDSAPVARRIETNFELLESGLQQYVEAMTSMLATQAEISEDFRGALEDQIGALEAVQLTYLETLATMTRDGTEPTDELFEDLSEMLEEQFETVLEAHEDVKVQTVDSLDEFGADIEALQTAFEDLQEQIEEATVATTEDVVEQVDIEIDGDDESLEVIDGLGPTYAGRLHDQGIDSLKALTDASATLVAETADVSVEEATAWIDAAQTSA